MALGEVGVLVARSRSVTIAAARRQRAGHRQRARARVGADLHDQRGSQRGDQRGQQPPDDVAGEHRRVGQRLGRLGVDGRPPARQRRGVRRGVVVDVRPDQVAHRAPSSRRRSPAERAAHLASEALVNSDGMIQILFASPWAICGSICRYW